MKMRGVCERTGMPKRTVHFYIQEGLLCPKMNHDNGYYDFTEEDCRRLLMIRDLRNADFSIAQIRALLDAPSTSVYYLNQKLKQLQTDIEHSQQVIAALNRIREKLPLHPGYKQLAALVEAAGIPEPPEPGAEGKYEDYDNLLVNRYLWENFLPDTPFTEYQEFLWNKINRLPSESNAADYRRLGFTLQNATEPEVKEFFFSSRQVHTEMISLREEEYADHVEQMKISICRLLRSPRLIKNWKQRYVGLTVPAARIYDSPVSGTMAELSPQFAAYRRNVHVVCCMLYEWLQSAEGEWLKREIGEKLAGVFDIEHCSHGELQAMAAYGQRNS